MSYIPFIEARFFDPEETQIALERRLSEHLRRMRAHDLPSAGSEKAGQAVSTKGQALGLAEALLSLLEPMTARGWGCPYYQVRFDLGWVGWVLTSNNWHLLPEPLLSRCPPLRLRELTSAELAGFIRREGMKRDLSEAAIDAILVALAHASSRGHRPSLRVASRLLQRAVELEHAPVRH